MDVAVVWSARERMGVAAAGPGGWALKGQLGEMAERYGPPSRASTVKQLAGRVDARVRQIDSRR